jgi:hypothetical protein
LALGLGLGLERASDQRENGGEMEAAARRSAW